MYFIFEGLIVPIDFMWTMEQKVLRLCCVNAMECSQVGADLATSLNHTKKNAQQFQVQIAIFAEKVERAARRRQC